MKWLFLLLGFVLGALVMFLIMWFLRRRQQAAEQATVRAVVSQPDGEPAADETPTGRIPALGPEFATASEPVAAAQPAQPAEPVETAEVAKPAAPAPAQPIADPVDPEPVVAASWEPGSFANSAKPLAGGASPGEEFTIKGNADSMLYHTKESPYYSRTKAEVWFRTAEDAEAAGFIGWNKRRQGAEPLTADS